MVIAWKNLNENRSIAMAEIHKRLIELLKQHPEGIKISDIRIELNLKTNEQTQLPRRIRELDQENIIERKGQGVDTLYVFIREKEVLNDVKKVDKTTRARIIHRDGYRCQMCGKTPSEDGVKLQIDHRIPQDWGGSSEDSNLWTLCAECNSGKKNYFDTITDPDVRKSMLNSEIWVRLGELLKAKNGEFVPKEILAIVAFSHDDWERRLRELRLIKWDYEVMKRKQGNKVFVSYRLTKWAEWPDDVGDTIRELDPSRNKKKQK